MSWQDELQKYPLVPITTGDGEVYEVKLVVKGGGIDTLTAAYNYPGKRGSKPKRNSSASPVYDLTFYINQEEFNAFKTSVTAIDNDWTIEHPLYKTLVGLPVGEIGWDNSKYNDVLVTLQFQESLKDEIPVILRDYKAELDKKNEEIRANAIENVGDIEFTPQDVSIISSLADSLEELYQNILNNDYINAIYDLKSSINADVFDSFRFMEAFNHLLILPVRMLSNPLDGLGTGLIASVKERNKIIKAQHQALLDLVPDSESLAIFKENALSVNITTLTETVSTPGESVSKLAGFDITDETEETREDDYTYKKDVTATIATVNELYDDFIVSIDAIDDFIPDDTINQNITNSVLLAIQEIKELSTRAKVQNIYITKSDTTPELLAFELYGSATDENIQRIIDDNDLFGKESLRNSWRNMIIRRNVEIIYYV